MLITSSKVFAFVTLVTLSEPWGIYSVTPIRELFKRLLSAYPLSASVFSLSQDDFSKAVRLLVSGVRVFISFAKSAIALALLALKSV